MGKGGQVPKGLFYSVCHCPGFLAGSSFIRKADFILTHLPLWDVWYSFLGFKPIISLNRAEGTQSILQWWWLLDLAGAMENLETQFALGPELCPGISWPLSGVTLCTQMPVFRVYFLLGEECYCLLQHSAFCTKQPPPAMCQVYTPGSQSTACSWKSLVTEKSWPLGIKVASANPAHS